MKKLLVLFLTIFLTSNSSFVWSDIEVLDQTQFGFGQSEVLTEEGLIIFDYMYYQQGQMKSETISLNGKLHGKQTWWHKNGDIKKIKYYKNGKKISLEEGKKIEKEIRIAEEKKAEEKRIAEEIKQKKKELLKKRIAEEKRIADVNKEKKRIESDIRKLKKHFKKLNDLELDSLKVEVEQLISEVKVNTSSNLTVLKSLTKTLREMDSSVELKIKTVESKQRILSLKDYPGFRDLKPGLHYDELTEFCHLRKGYWVKCYGIDNIKFYGKFKNDVLYELILDMGPIVNTEGFLSVFGENDSNIFIKMRNTMDKNYSRDYGYSERDRQLFNESEKSRLYRVYSKGQVVLEISRKEKDWYSDLWLYIHYLDPSKAEKFLEENRPVRASEDDF